MRLSEIEKKASDNKCEPLNRISTVYYSSIGRISQRQKSKRARELFPVKIPRVASCPPSAESATTLLRVWCVQHGYYFLEDCLGEFRTLANLTLWNSERRRLMTAVSNLPSPFRNSEKKKSSFSLF